MDPRSLTVNSTPYLITECYHQIRASIVLANEGLFPWFFSNFVNVKVIPRGKEKFPMIRLEDHVDIYEDVLDERVLSAEVLESTIINEINDDRYVVVFLDWSKIPQSNYYNKQSIIHECLIYGYDPIKQYYKVLAFEINNNRYTSVNLSFKDVEYAFNYGLIQKHQNRWFHYYGYPAIGIKLKSKQESINLKKIFFAYDRSPIKGNINEPNNASMGQYSFLLLSEYFHLLANKEDILPQDEYSFWNIMNVKLIEHNKIALDRSSYLVQNSLLHKVKKLFSEKQKNLIKIRSYSLKYQRTRETIHLQDISKYFYACYEVERRVHALIKEYLVEK